MPCTVKYGRNNMKLITIFSISLLLIGLIVSESASQVTPQWIARYSNVDKKGVDVAAAMATDDTGNVYVTGYSSLGSVYTLLTIKYSPDGILRWVASYKSHFTAKSKAIAVDTMKNVYVAAAIDSGGSRNFLTIKYNSSGVMQWMQMYDGPGHGEDQPAAIAVSDSMQVFITGYSLGSGSSFDITTLKYGVSGNQLWEKRYNGKDNGDDRGIGLALYSHTSLYVVGMATDTMTDYATLKYSAVTGDSLWLVTYNGPANGNDIPSAIMLHGSTEVYVTGTSQGIGTGNDYATMKISSSGVVDWISRYNGTANGDDRAYAMAYGSKVYVSGRSLQPGGYFNMVTVGYGASDGSEDWVSSFNGTANDDDYPVALYPQGSYFYVLGATTSSGLGLDYALIRYRGSNGLLQWSMTYNGPGNANDIPAAMGQSNGVYYVTGGSDGGKSGQDILTIGYADPNSLKYRTFIQADFAGKPVALKNNSSVPNTASVRDAAYAAAFPKVKTGYPGAPGGLVLGIANKDSQKVFGWVRVTKGAAIANMVPQTTPPSPYYFVGEMKDPKLVKMNNALVGDLLALKINIAASDARITPPTFGDLVYDDNDTSNHYNGMSLRQLASFIDNILTFGSRYPGINYVTLDTVLQKVNSAFNGPLGVVSAYPKLYISGYKSIDSVSFLTPGAAPLVNPLTLPEGAITSDENVLVPEQYILYQNYPNPFNPTTNIQFDLPVSSNVTLKIYNMLGQEVATLLDDEAFDAGKQEVSFNASDYASGVYFYRLVVNGGEFQTIKKMVLVK
jgi:hypothetical protein